MLLNAAFPADCLHSSHCHCHPFGMTSSGRYSGVPAYSQILLRQRSHLRTVIVTAAVYRGFGSQLRPPCGRLTTPLNLPAPGRSQTLYVVFDLAESCVFSKQSLGAFHCDLPSLRFARNLTTASTPSSEVTVLICRVPSRGITHAPWNSLPVYLCRFAVRSASG